MTRLGNINNLLLRDDSYVMISLRFKKRVLSSIFNTEHAHNTELTEHYFHRIYFIRLILYDGFLSVLSCVRAGCSKSVTHHACPSHNMVHPSS